MTRTDNPPKQASRSCRRCGTKNPAGAEFCSRCGERLRAAKVSSKREKKGRRQPSAGQQAAEAVTQPQPDFAVNRIYCGDCLEVMGSMPDNFVDIIVTSPPYNFGLDGYEGPQRTFKEIGAIVGLTRERVRQLEKKALASLAELAEDLI